MSVSKRIAAKIFTSLVILLVLGAAVAVIFFTHASGVDSIGLTVSIGDRNEMVKLTKSRDGYYALLPSSASLEHCTLSVSDPSISSVTVDSREYRNGDSLGGLLLGTEYDAKINKRFGLEASFKITFMKSDKIPSFHIGLIDGTLSQINGSTTKTVEKEGTFSILSSGGDTLSSGGIKSIHGRGNTSWYEPKRSYTMELDVPMDLLGMGMAQKWLLIANACDESGLRNKIVYDTAAEAGLKYSPESRYIDLYVDGEYLGLYLLCEKIEAGAERIAIAPLEENTQAKNEFRLKTYPGFSDDPDGILKNGYNIPNDPSDITGGYLIELQLAYRVKEITNYFRTGSGQYVAVDYPSAASKAQLEYISDLICRLEARLNDGTVADMIDIESWARYYLIEEIFANTECTSFFFYKNSDTVDPKIYAGPVWDFDLAIGQCWGNTDTPADTHFVNTWGWFGKLYENEVFLDKVRADYENDVRGRVLDALDRIDDYAGEIASAYEMDRIRWADEEPFDWAKHFDSLSEHADDLKAFIEKRIEYLDHTWIDGNDEICVYTQSNASVTKNSFCALRGNEDEIFAVPDEKGYEFLGWFNAETGEKWTEDTVITSSCRYNAKWEKTGVATSTIGRIKAVAYEYKWVIIMGFGLCLAIAADLWVNRKGRKKR